MLGMQRGLSLIYPDRCLICETPVEEAGGLCAACWRETPFITGLACDLCGAPLPGDDGGTVLCDDCLAMPRPWEAGRAVLVYEGAGRRIVLALKHADRLDMVPDLARWMARSGQRLLAGNPLLVPVPAHWSRLLRRRYNQAAELSRALARATGLEHCPDALVRSVRTAPQEGMTVENRFHHLRDAIHPNPRRVNALRGRAVCLIDDVMTSGATLSYATEAAIEAGARQVCVLVLARVVKAP